MSDFSKSGASVEELWGSAKAYFEVHYGPYFPSSSEDFAQYCALKYLERGHISIWRFEARNYLKHVNDNPYIYIGWEYDHFPPETVDPLEHAQEMALAKEEVSILTEAERRKILIQFNRDLAAARRKRRAGYAVQRDELLKAFRASGVKLPELCPKGHQMSEDNLVLRPGRIHGGCLTCQRERVKLAMRRRKSCQQAEEASES